MATSVPETKKWGKARSVCWTLNNYTDADVAALRMYATECKYMVFGYEIAPTTGTPHLQGYVAWENPRSIEKFMKIPITKGIHVEKTRGSPLQASNYCKEDGKFEEFGELPAQGARTDWESAHKMLKEGADVTAVIEAQPSLLPCQRALREFKAMLLKPLHRDVNVIVLIGGAGTGKTRYAYDTYPDLYSKPRGEWWDGYSGQKTILLDDYYGYLPYCELLRVLDRYPYQVPVKGGFVYAQWDTVIITSNDPPQLWYKSMGLTPALRRRIVNTFSVESIDGVSSFTPLFEEAPPSPPPPCRKTQSVSQAEHGVCLIEGDGINDS